MYANFDGVMRALKSEVSISAEVLRKKQFVDFFFYIKPALKKGPFSILKKTRSFRPFVQVT